MLDSDLDEDMPKLSGAGAEADGTLGKESGDQLALAESNDSGSVGDTKVRHRPSCEDLLRCPKSD